MASVLSLALAQMVVFAVAGGGAYGGKAFVPAVLMFPAFIAACGGAAAFVRLRRAWGQPH